MSTGHPISQLLDLIVGSRCAGCGGAGRGVEPCRSCLHELLSMPAAPGAAFADRGAAARMVRIAKRGDWRGAAPVLAGLAIRRGLIPLDVDAVTWVPSDPRRRARRGGHLPRRVATSIARQCGLPAVDLLARVPGSAPQRGMDRAARLANARAAFTSRCAPRGLLAPAARVLLIDDVRTTGATLAACTALLEDEGLQVRARALIGVNRDDELADGAVPAACAFAVSGVPQKYAASVENPLTNSRAVADGNDQPARKEGT